MNQLISLPALTTEYSVGTLSYFSKSQAPFLTSSHFTSYGHKPFLECFTPLNVSYILNYITCNCR